MPGPVALCAGMCEVEGGIQKGAALTALTVPFFLNLQCLREHFQHSQAVTAVSR